MSEYDHEPIRGLPEELPEDEHILWQGAPDWKSLAKSALHIRLAAVYFAVMIGLALARADFGAAAMMGVFAALVIGFFVLFAYGVGRTSVYTLTNKRIVLRIGVALNTCINIPLSEIESADLKMISSGKGSILMKLKGQPRMGYFMLWPHARSLRIVRPQPMLRAIPEAERVGRMLTDAAREMQPVEATTNQSRTPTLEGVPA